MWAKGLEHPRMRGLGESPKCSGLGQHLSWGREASTFGDSEAKGPRNSHPHSAGLHLPGQSTQMADVMGLVSQPTWLSVAPE